MAGYKLGEKHGNQHAGVSGGTLLPVVWRKSSYSNHQSACVEVSRIGQETVCLRDSKDPEGPVLTFTRNETVAFLASVVAGEFPDSL